MAGALDAARQTSQICEAWTTYQSTLSSFELSTAKWAHDLKSRSSRVAQLCWDSLHCDEWHLVHPIWRLLYGLCSRVRAACLALQGDHATAMRSLDVALMITGPAGQDATHALINALHSVIVANSVCDSDVPGWLEEIAPSLPAPPAALLIKRAHGMSFEQFRDEHMIARLEYYLLKVFLLCLLLRIFLLG